MTKENAVCGKKTEVYSRVVGYYRPTNGWNPGKRSEFHDRKLFSLNPTALNAFEKKIEEAEAAERIETLPAAVSEERVVNHQENSSPAIVPNLSFAL